MLKVFTLILIFLGIILFIINLNSDFENIFDSKKQPPIIYDIKEVLNKDIEIVFCPSTDCQILFLNSFNNAKNEIKCAFYDFSEDNLSQILISKSRIGINIELIIDSAYTNRDAVKSLENENIFVFSDINRGTRYNNYMHHKFCVIDNEIIITSSANPTQRGFFHNDNNIIKIESKYLTQNYENEFEQMKRGVFGTNKKSMLNYNNITMIFENETYLVSSYFCPQDVCEREIINALNLANSSIFFAAFALTNSKIEDILTEKSSLINVSGVVERRNLNIQGSRIAELNKSFEIRIDNNKYNMHHKFFIIDKKIIITGSMNPSNSGAYYNDENILIIENKKFANMFFEEFERIYDLS